MDDAAIFSTHSGGNVCMKEREIASGYPGEPCLFLPRLHATLESVWKAASIAVSPMPLWQDFHGFQYATDGVPPHRVAPVEIDRRIRARLTPLGEERHPNLAGELKYYSGYAHRNMHLVESSYWRYLKTITDVLTPANITIFFNQSGTNFEGLSEMKVCHCDPHQCLFHNGKKGPLVKASDVYEVEPGEIDGVLPEDENTTTGADAARRLGEHGQTLANEAAHKTAAMGLENAAVGGVAGAVPGDQDEVAEKMRGGIPQEEQNDEYEGDDEEAVGGHQDL